MCAICTWLFVTIAFKDVYMKRQLFTPLMHCYSTSVVHCTYMLLSCHRYCIVIASADSHAHVMEIKVNEPVS